MGVRPLFKDLKPSSVVEWIAETLREHRSHSARTIFLLGDFYAAVRDRLSSPGNKVDRETLLERLDKEGLSLLILKKGVALYSAKKGGMTPLVEAIDRLGPRRLSNSTIVDKIVGRAAALLISYFGASEVYSKVMSGHAEEILDRHRIKHFSQRIVEVIKNRDNVDICPFERMVLKIEDPQEGYKRIRRSIKST